MRRAALFCLILPALSQTGACLMSLDENRWKSASDAPLDHAAQDLKVESPDGAGQSDGAGDDRRLADGPADGNADLTTADLARTDLPRSDQARADQSKLDGVKADLAKPADSVSGDKLAADNGGCSQMVLDLEAAEDDGEISGTTFYPDGETQMMGGGNLYMGTWNNQVVTSYFRFALTQAIPAGATLSSANLRLHGDKTSQWTASSAVQVTFENSADAPLVTSAADSPAAMGRAVLSPAKRWPASGGLTWLSNQYNQTPDLAGLLQQLVTSKSGLALGSHLQLWVQAVPASTGKIGTPNFKSSGYSSHPARLTVTWCK